jgi:hypothetical protein
MRSPVRPVEASEYMHIGLGPAVIAPIMPAATFGRTLAIAAFKRDQKAQDPQPPNPANAHLCGPVIPGVGGVVEWDPPA